MNIEFHSAAVHSANAFDHDQLTAGRGLFLFLQYHMLQQVLAAFAYTVQKGRFVPAYFLSTFSN